MKAAFLNEALGGRGGGQNDSGAKKVCRLAASDVREIPRTLSNSLENMLGFIKFENLDGNVTLGLIKQ